MSNRVNAGPGATAARTFILGREGHIYISDPAASKEHAELKLIDGRIHLRDLNSTNGIYLVKNDKPVRFHKGFVDRNQVIVIGTQQHSIHSLLAMINVFID